MVCAIKARRGRVGGIDWRPDGAWDSHPCVYSDRPAPAVVYGFFATCRITRITGLAVTARKVYQLEGEMLAMMVEHPANI